MWGWRSKPFTKRPDLVNKIFGKIRVLLKITSKDYLIKISQIYVSTGQSTAYVLGSNIQNVKCWNFKSQFCCLTLAEHEIEIYLAGTHQLAISVNDFNLILIALLRLNALYRHSRLACTINITLNWTTEDPPRAPADGIVNIMLEHGRGRGRGRPQEYL